MINQEPISEINDILESSDSWLWEYETEINGDKINLNYD